MSFMTASMTIPNQHRKSEATMTITERIADWSVIRRSNFLRTFRMAAWLGWQIESNWADPFLFAIYSIARPIAGVMILVMMYLVVGGNKTGDERFAFIYLGNSLYIMVFMVITGVSWVIIEDREHYKVAKQLHTTPINHYAYLMGRGVARLLIGSLSVTISVGFGAIALHIPVSLLTINWPLLAAAFVLGIIALASMGLMLGSTTMMLTRDAWNVGDAVAGALYIFSGAIFPLEILPLFLRPIGYALPITYWLEVTRRALLGVDQLGFATLAWLSNMQLIGILLVFAVGLVIASFYYYEWALNMAKERGVLDIETGY